MTGTVKPNRRSATALEYLLFDLTDMIAQVINPTILTTKMMDSSCLIEVNNLLYDFFDCFWIFVANLAKFLRVLRSYYYELSYNNRTNYQTKGGRYD